MRAAFDLPSDGGTAQGEGVVPTWLTKSNADTVRKAPCINGLIEDLGCWYCQPTPKPADLEEQLAQAKAATASAAARSSGEGATGDAASPTAEAEAAAAEVNMTNEFDDDDLTLLLPKQEAAR